MKRKRLDEWIDDEELWSWWLTDAKRCYLYAVDYRVFHVCGAKSDMRILELQQRWAKARKQLNWFQWQFFLCIARSCYVKTYREQERLQPWISCNFHLFWSMAVLHSIRQPITVFHASNPECRYSTHIQPVQYGLYDTNLIIDGNTYSFFRSWHPENLQEQLRKLNRKLGIHTWDFGIWDTHHLWKSHRSDQVYFFPILEHVFHIFISHIKSILPFIAPLNDLVLEFLAWNQFCAPKLEPLAWLLDYVVKAWK